MKKPDKYYELRINIIQFFKENRNCYGYRRIHSELMYVFKIRIIRLKNCSKTWAGLKYGCVETCNGTWGGLKGGWVETCNRRCIERWNGLKHGVG